MLPRVLQVIPAIAPRYGGPSVAVLGMGRALRAARVWTVVATTDADGPGHLDVPLGEIVAHDDVPSIFFRRLYSESFKWSPGLARWLMAHVAEFDLVHVHGVFSHVLIATARACRVRGVPYIVRPLGTLDPWSLARHGWRKQVLLRGWGRRAIAGAAAMHFTSDEERRLATTTLPWLPPGEVVPLGVEDGLFAGVGNGREAPGASPYILSLARLDPKKGINRLIGAFHEATGRGGCRDWRLVIAGDGEPGYVQALQALAQAGPAAPRIAFEGWVTGDARRALIQQASVFALPSSQENFGIGVVEAMAAGVPVIVSPGVNLALEIEAAEAGWVARAETLAESLAAVCASPAEIRARGAAARQWAEQYRWPRVTRALLDLYADVAGRAERAERAATDARRSLVATDGRF